MRLCFDIGANRGEATRRALELGFDKVIALECAPRMFPLLKQNFAGDPRVTPLPLAVTDENNKTIEFYECGNGEYNQGDGSSTTELYWLTDPKSRVSGMAYRTVKVTTCTVDWLMEKFGIPELLKIDIEGGEHKVLRSMSGHPEKIAFEWHLEYLDEYIEDINKLGKINGYTEYALQYITHHMKEPIEYRPISEVDKIYGWIAETKDAWEQGGWLEAGWNQSADVGMLWVR